MSDYAAIARNLFSISAVEAEQFGERPEDQTSFVAAKAIETLVAEAERLRAALHSITLSYDERCGIDHATLARSALEAKP